MLGCRELYLWDSLDSALDQARDHCKAAVSNSGQEWPILPPDHQPQPSHPA